MTAAKRDPEAELIEEIAAFDHDPLGFARFAFPWGEVGTELEGESGPRDWQADILTTIGERLRQGVIDGHQPIRIAVASGHGIGKSALVGMVIHWAMSTMPMTKVVVTASTGVQLRTKTWPEVAKWHNLSICRHWFSFEATSIRSADPRHKDLWRCDQVTWSDNNTQAFAGLHNKKRRIVLIFDEASAISDKVWEVAQGALTDEDTEIIWLAFGNPTEPSGQFRACFGANKSRWITRQIDARKVPGTNLTEIAGWVEQWGDDSDFVRVRVKGEFPRQAAMQFIATDVVAAARLREVQTPLDAPFICGVDVARFGDDATVIMARKGRDTRLMPWLELRGLDGNQVADRVALLHQQYKFDAIHVDAGGVGASVYDRLILMGLGGTVRAVEFGGKADAYRQGQNALKYANKRAEMWGAMREAMATLAIPDDPDLAAQLTTLQYGFNIRDEIQLERKEDMKKRGLASPDKGDALALTFAYPVFPRPQAGGPQAQWTDPRLARAEYDPFA